MDVPVEDPRLETAIEAGERAGSLQRDRLGSEMDVSEKGRHDLVTEVDVESERRIVDLIGERHPDDAVLAEESGASGDAEIRWIVDPLDGTTNYHHRLPPYAVSIAVEDAGELAVGVVHLTATGETYAAVAGEGAYLDGDPISVSEREPVEDCLVVVGVGPDADVGGRAMAALGRIAERTRGFRRPGAAAADLAYVADGRADGCYLAGASDWDVAAGALLVAEAGGRFEGRPRGPDATTSAAEPLLASNGAVHDGLADLVR